MSCTVPEAMDPRVRRTRKLLQDAFRCLIEEKAFSAISVQDIAERATVNRATFYAHYVDKEALAASVLKHDFHTALYQLFSERPALTPENLTTIAVGVFEFMGNHGKCPENGKALQDTVGSTVQQGLYEMLDGWLSHQLIYKRLFPGCTKETVATVISWSIYGGANHWSQSKNRSPAIQVCREIVSMLFRQAETK